jgi:PKD repeat protein
MKKIRTIFFLSLLFSVFIISAQNKKMNSTLPHVENLPPIANFSWVNTCFGDTTCFIDQSIRGNTYTWTISADSTNSHGGHFPRVLHKSINDSVMCYHFNKAGNYSVTLTAFDNHFDSITKIITIDTTTKAAFSFIECNNYFMNNSLCISSCYWDFGDGSNSTIEVPYHLYADTGNYKVTLIVYNGTHSDTLSKQIHIDVTSYARANFTNNISNDTLFVHAGFSQTGVSYNWTFNDGTFATGKDTFHVYKDSSAFYLVGLVTVNSCGPVFGDDTIHIIKKTPDAPPANLDFSHSILEIVPNPVSTNNYVNAFFNSYNDNIYLAQVYNSLGEKMFEEYFSFQSGINEFKISTSNLSSGVYVLALQAGNSYVRQKFYIVNKP